MRFLPILPIILAASLLTACESSTHPSLLQTESAPGAAMQEDPPLDQLPISADLGTLLWRYNDTVQLYGTCRMRHKALIDYETSKGSTTP